MQTYIVLLAVLLAPPLGTMLGGFWALNQGFPVSLGYTLGGLCGSIFAGIVVYRACTHPED